MAGKPAATVGSNHSCPMCSGITPHVGGPITQGSPDVFINDKPVARIGDICTCNGGPDTIVTGNSTVLINGLPIACVGDQTSHGAVIISGSSNVIIGSRTSKPATAVMAVKKIPFPKITFINRVLGNAKEAIVNQQAIRELAENTEGEPRVYNLRWRREETIIRDRKIFNMVILTADVINIPDGQAATVKVLKPSSNGNEEDQVVELTGTVKNKRITVEWELEDASANENSNN